MTETPRTRFGPERVALVPVVVLTVGAVPLALSGGLFPLVLLVPLACLVYVLRARVVVGPDGLEVCQGLGVRTVPWPRVEGFDVLPRGRVALLADGERSVLRPVPRERRQAFLAAAEQASRAAR